MNIIHINVYDRDRTKKDKFVLSGYGTHETVLR